MTLLSALLFAVPANLDTLLIGISFGLRGCSLKLWQNLLVSLITLLGTLFSLGAGTLLLAFFPVWLTQLLGSLILLCMGLFYTGRFLYSLRYTTQKIPDTSAPSVLSLFFLGIGLSANNIGMGISAGFAGLSLTPALCATFLCASGFLSLGNRLGRCRMLKITADLADLLSGILMAGLGILMLYL